MIVSMREPCSVHSFSSHWVIDWKEWVWFTCVKVRETVCRREAVTRKKASCKPYSCGNERKCGLLLCSLNVFYIKKALEWRLELPFFLWMKFLTHSKSGLCSVSQACTKWNHWWKMGRKLLIPSQAKVIVMQSPLKSVDLNSCIRHTSLEFFNH